MAHSTLSANLRALMKAHITLNSQAAVGSAAKINQTTVGRILRGAHSPTLENIEALARCFNISAWQILMPGLDPENLPVAQTAGEKELYLRLQRIVAELPKS